MSASGPAWPAPCSPCGASIPTTPRSTASPSGEWLADHGQSGRAIERLWDLITLPTVNLPAAEASLAMAAKVFRTGLLDSTDAGDIGWSPVPLGRLHGRNASRALSAAGVDVRLGSRVEGLARSAEGGWAVSTPEGPDRVDAVIVATPPEVAATLVPEGTLPAMRAWAHRRSSTCTWCSTARVTDLPMAAGVDSPVQFVFDRTASSGVRRAVPGHLLVGRRRLHGPATRGAGPVVPPGPGRPSAVGPARPLVDGVVTREHSATFRAVPGTAALRPSARTGLPGLVVAGAWCDTGWPATMEGAVRSGQSAAGWLHRPSAGGTAAEPARRDTASAGNTASVTNTVARPPAPRSTAMTTIPVSDAPALAPDALGRAAAWSPRRWTPRSTGSAPSWSTPFAITWPAAASGCGPRLVLLSAAAAGGREEVGIPGAVAIELVHNFSLLHDDIIDEDRERRHRPTVWAQFGVGTAIIAGDALAALAIQVLLEIRPPSGCGPPPPWPTPPRR